MFLKELPDKIETKLICELTGGTKETVYGIYCKGKGRNRKEN